MIENAKIATRRKDCHAPLLESKGLAGSSGPGTRMRWRRKRRGQREKGEGGKEESMSRGMLRAFDRDSLPTRHPMIIQPISHLPIQCCATLCLSHLSARACTILNKLCLLLPHAHTRNVQQAHKALVLLASGFLPPPPSTPLALRILPPPTSAAASCGY